MIKFWSKFHNQILWYSFTRQNRFLITPSKSLPGPSFSTSRHVSNNLSVILSSILNSVMKGRKYRSRESNKRADRLCMKFSLTLNTSVQRCLYLLFQNQCPILFRINKMVNKHTVDYHPSPSEFTSRINLLIFLWTPKGFISPEHFWNFFSNLYIPSWLQKSFKFMVLRLLENTFVSQKIESVYWWPQAKLSPRFLSSPLQTEGNYPFPQKSGEGLWSWKYDQN